MMWRPLVSTETVTCLCYGSLSLFQSLLHNVFLLYHVETFLSIYGIGQLAFWASEFAFLLWNSCNDQLFGWISDSRYLQGTTDQKTVVLRRVRSIQLAGPMLAVAFMIFWVNWAPAGLQFVFCLCLYDSALTVVDLQHSALLADLSVTSEGRVRLGTYGAVFGGLGSASVFLSHLFWDRESPTTFRTFCLILAIFSALGFLISCKCITNEFRRDKDEKHTYSKIEQSEASSVKVYARQITKHKNFCWFAAMNLVQVFNCHFNSNFFPMFLDTLVAGRLSTGLSSTLLGVSFLAPHVNNLFFMHLCHKWGTYIVVKRLFLVKILLGILLWCGGSSQIYLLCFFIASNRIFTEGICKLLNLVVSDLVDEDMVLQGRPQAVAALIFGTSALLSKPGQTLAPVIGTWLLGWRTGRDQFRMSDKTQWLSAAGEGGTAHGYVRNGNDAHGCFWLLVWVPLTCACIQSVMWTRFNLHGTRLLWIKKLRTDREYTHHNQNI